jgi:hypothetical protein
MRSVAWRRSVLASRADHFTDARTSGRVSSPPKERGPRPPSRFVLPATPCSGPISSEGTGLCAPKPENGLSLRRRPVRMGRKRRDDKSNNGKPFVHDELLARMRAVLRRSNGPRHARLAVCDLEIDLASRMVRVGGLQVQLSAKEDELLVALAEDPERVFKKEELLRNVWGFAHSAGQGPWTPHASRLRRKLARRAGPPSSSMCGAWGAG